MNTQDVTLSVVESDEPSHVRMFNSIGCDLGVWPLDQWQMMIARGEIILQPGDKFVMEE